MVTWGRAWRGAAACLGWTILWGLAGIGLIAGGIAVIFWSIFSSAQYIVYGSVNSLLGGVIGGFVLIFVGELIVGLGARAAFFKINSEIISEEVKRQLQAPAPATCPTCGGPLRFVEQVQRWYCDREGKYV